MSGAGQPGDGGVRAGLLSDIRDRRQEFEAAGERAEELRTLPPDTVQTLRRMRVFWLKTPRGLAAGRGRAARVRG
jgi:hypothetical protein